LLRRLGLEVRRPFRPPDAFTVDVIGAVRRYTMTTPERISALVQAVRYVTSANVPGAIVECGVWRGGSMMAVANTLLTAGAQRNLYLFDTYEGMPELGELDTRTQDGVRPNEAPGWLAASAEDVAANMRSTGYPRECTHIVKGMVEDTIPAAAPDSIALLRLDTDLYASTKHELVHLYPRLHHGGVLILDDYGDWDGARLAVDEYLQEHGIHILLNHVDTSARIALKP
jgi:hypothetical protein